MVVGVALMLVPSLKELLDSVAYRNRARGKAEIIRAERSVEAPRPLPPGARKQTRQQKGEASG